MAPRLRPTAVAGMFYPASPRALLEEVDASLASAPRSVASRAPKALIVPHAGHRYSGPIAATAYATLLPFADRIHRVILVGPSHRVYFTGLALPDAQAFETPLGPVSVDREAVQQLHGGAPARPGPLSGALGRGGLPFVPMLGEAHAREHALEVELPFLIRVLPHFSIVPLVVGEATGADVAAVLDALWGGPETLIVISSDLSHYLPYEEGRRVDEATAQRIVSLGPPLTHEEACGATPVNGLLLAAARRGLRPELLDLRSSGDTAGGRDEVVGYGAFAFYEQEAGDGA